MGSSFPQKGEVMDKHSPGGTYSARVIEVIETTACRGAGTKEDMARIVIQYWDFKGNLLAENDPENSPAILSAASTKDLCNELTRREAVQRFDVEPYKPYTITVGSEVSTESGPAIIFKVWD